MTHSNPQIDPSRTHINDIWVNDGAGNMVPATSVTQWYDVITERLATVQHTRRLKDGRVVAVEMRKDATVVIDCVFMLDPEYTGRCEDMSDEMRADVTEKLWVMVATMTRKVGALNVVGWTIHWDETHPHVQMMITPIDDQHRLRWQSFVDGRLALEKVHDEFRADLRAAGYDATAERINDGKRGLGLREYKRRQDVEREKSDNFRQQRTQLEAMASQVKPQWAALDQRKADSAAESAALEAEREELRVLRRDAQAEGRQQGLDEVGELRRQAERDAAKAGQELAAASETRSAVQAHLQALEDDLDAVEQAPVWSPPAWDEVKPEAMKNMPDLLRRYLARQPKVAESFERFAESEWSKHVARNQNSLGEYAGLSRERWVADTRSSLDRIRRAIPSASTSPTTSAAGPEKSSN